LASVKPLTTTSNPKGQIHATHNKSGYLINGFTLWKGFTKIAILQ